MGKNQWTFLPSFLLVSLLLSLFVPTTSAQWENLPGKCTDIAAGGGSVWCIGESSQVYNWDESAFAWQSAGGEANTVAVDSEGTPWVIEGKQVYRQRGKNWQNMPGKCIDIAGGGGSIWCVGQSKEVFKWNEEAFSWQSAGGEANTVAVDSEGTAWVLENKKVYRFRGKL